MRHVATIFLAMLLCGCEPPPTEGTVVSREHKEAYTTSGYHSVGSRRFPYRRKHPESWRVTFTGFTKSGKKMENTVKVSKETFDVAEAGTFFKAK